MYLIVVEKDKPNSYIESKLLLILTRFYCRLQIDIFFSISNKQRGYGCWKMYFFTSRNIF